MQAQLPATLKANNLEIGADVKERKESGVFSGADNLADGGLTSQSPSQHLSGGRGVYKKGEGNRRDRGGGLKSSLCADEHSPFH